MALLKSAQTAISKLAKDPRVREAVADVAETVRRDGSGMNPDDFLSAREGGKSEGTEMTQLSVPLADAGETVNRSFLERSPSGRVANVISPVVIPARRTLLSFIPVLVLLIVGVLGLAIFGTDGDAMVFFGPHYWALVVVVAAYQWWRRSVVMVPEGCQALITKFGKLEEIAGPGRKVLLNPWKGVSYIVNTTREYPYNAPIREAPTQGGVKASVDLFLQFRIEDPAEFIFTLGAVKGFSDKLQNAISEVTRALIYEQRAEDIYDLVGESTQGMLESLNQQFLPAVRFVNANITHAESSSQEYRMDLAAPEMVRLAKEAYTFEYELSLRKEQNEGDLNKELATLNETLSAIRAEIAGYQAQMDTALERETNRAKSLARQRFVEAESTANANAALLEAQALDIKAVGAASAPELLEYRFQRDVLDRLGDVAERMPQVVRVGDGADGGVDYPAIARRMVGTADTALFSGDDLDAIRGRMGSIEARIRGREPAIEELLAVRSDSTPVVEQPAQSAVPGEEKVEEIRQSVADEAIDNQLAERVAELGEEVE